MIVALVLLALAPGQAGPSTQSVPSYRISGSVVDAITAAPIPHAQVATYPDGGDSEAGTAAGEDGSFSFEGVEPGKKYRVYASAPGYLSEGYNQHGSFLVAVAVGEGLDSEHIVIRLHPDAVIYGVVTDEHGEPVRHAQITLFGRIPGRTRPGPRGGAGTNDLGAYRFSHLPSGKYYLAVQAQPWYAQTGFKYSTKIDAPRPSGISFTPGPGSFVSSASAVNPALDVVYPITFYQSATDEHQATEIDLVPGDEREANIQLAAVPSVHIRVTSLPTDPAQWVGFNASQAAFGNALGGVMGIAYRQIVPGEYEVAGLPPINVTLTVNEAESRTRTIGVDLATTETIDTAATRASGTIWGQLILPADAAAPAQGFVNLTNEQNASFSAQLRKGASFSFESVEPGSYKVSISVNKPHGESYVERLSAVGAKTQGREVTVDAGASARLTITVGYGAGQITGIAKRDGKPFAGAMVLLVPESGQNVEEDHRMDESDSDGTFALRNIIPGKYILLAIDNGWDLNWTDPAALAPYRDKGQLVQVAPYQTLKIAVEVEQLVAADSGTANIVK